MDDECPISFQISSGSIVHLKYLPSSAKSWNAGQRFKACGRIRLSGVKRIGVRVSRRDQCRLAQVELPINVEQIVRDAASLRGKIWSDEQARGQRPKIGATA